MREKEADNDQKEEEDYVDNDTRMKRIRRIERERDGKGEEAGRITGCRTGLVPRGPSRNRTSSCVLNDCNRKASRISPPRALGATSPHERSCHAYEADW